MSVACSQCKNTEVVEHNNAFLSHNNTFVSRTTTTFFICIRATEKRKTFCDDICEVNASFLFFVLPPSIMLF